MEGMPPWRMSSSPAGCLLDAKQEPLLGMSSGKLPVFSLSAKAVWIPCCPTGMGHQRTSSSCDTGPQKVMGICFCFQAGISEFLFCLWGVVSFVVGSCFQGRLVYAWSPGTRGGRTLIRLLRLLCCVNSYNMCDEGPNRSVFTIPCTF